MKNKLDSILTKFCTEHSLPDSYKTQALKYFAPLAQEINGLYNTTPLFIGINGCQGSGKSTLSELLSILLTQLYNKNVLNISIDDFYHTKQVRQQLAENIHPLFITRGVPGTHDITLLHSILEYCNKPNSSLAIPRFNKAIDDQYSETEWNNINTPVDIILLEGWCIGVSAESEEALARPINKLEEEEDLYAIWRRHVNNCIKNEYEGIFKKIDHLIMLQAPSFNCVYEWRKIQEDKLRMKTQSQANNHVMNQAQLERFIQHYQRLTEHMLSTLPTQADIVYQLGFDHKITQRLQ